MVGKNNWKEKHERSADKIFKYSIKKLMLVSHLSLLRPD